MIPFKTPFILPLLYPSLLWRIPAEKKIYLTFDDGPVEGPTQFVLDSLSPYNAKATFFCIGDNVRKHARVFQQITNSGHAVANHTFNHLSGWKTSDEVYVENIKACDAELQKNGRATKLFRPPYGKIKRSQIARLADYKIVMWDVLTHDYSPSLNCERGLRKSIAATTSGSIVVFHDSYKAEKNLQFMLPRYLDHFASRGYTFESIP